MIRAFAESLSHAGPAYVLAFGGIVLFVVKVWPTIAEMIKRREDREDRREEREAEAEKERVAHDREMVQLNARSLDISERMTTAVEGVQSEMKVNNAMFHDSKENSRRMSETLDDTSRKVTEIHKVLIPARGEGTD